MKSLYISIIALFCVGISGQAQHAEKIDTTVDRTLILEREYNPTVNDAFKINELPGLKEPEATKAEIEFSNFSVPYQIKPQIPTLLANAYFTDMKYSAKKGYLNAGLSTLMDITGELGYQLLNDKTNELNIWATHRSSNSKVKYLQSDEKQKMKINDNKIGIAYINSGPVLKVFTDVDYTYSGYNYYGYSLPSLSSHFETADKGVNQVDQIINANAGLLSSKSPDELNYLFKINYSHFGKKYAPDKSIAGPKENYFQLDMGLSKGLGSDMLIGFNGYFRSSTYSLDKDNANLQYEGYESFSDLGLNPYIKFEGTNWSAKLGLLLDLLFNHEKNANIAPDIVLHYRPSENFLLYLNAGGGVADNSAKSIYRENRYISPLFRVQDAYSPFDGTLGFKVPLGNFWMDIFTGYKYTRQEHFYLPGRLSYEYENIIGANFAEPIYRDEEVFRLGANLKYEYGDLIDCGIKVVYNGRSIRNKNKDQEDKTYYDYAWNKPVFEGDAVLGIKVPDFPLRFDLMYHLGTGRKSLNKETKIKDINELNIEGLYAINNSFSLVAKVNNLLNQKYDLWYGYPAQGICFTGGVNIKF